MQLTSHNAPIVIEIAKAVLAPEYTLRKVATVAKRIDGVTEECVKDIAAQLGLVLLHDGLGNALIGLADRN